MKEKIIEIINEVAGKRPYKEKGNRDSYSEYNEGWTDACDVIEQKVIELIQPTTEKPEDMTMTFEAFVNYGLRHSDNIVDGMPWSFDFYGHPVTHETDEHYIIPYQNGQIDFKKGQTLQICGNLIFLNEPTTEESKLSAEELFKHRYVKLFNDEWDMVAKLFDYYDMIDFAEQYANYRNKSNKNLKT